ncbi:MAG: hypothetical protein KatS3mg105_2177 [Gemmatales bacterium]|nr:MAG: hypothetical protein KatS3mg105_2177 [Gemmatales bacterium]
MSRHRLLAASAFWFVLCFQGLLRGQDADLIALQEAAMKAAAAKVAPSIVQIQTSGGLDIIKTSGRKGGVIRKGVGPTTGVIVDPDGYIISSAFNFVNKPTEIFVAVPGKKDRYVAKVVANDHTRMLTLLKIEEKGLPVPEAAPKKEIQVGQWSLALGRTWSSVDDPPSISVGIISAVERIWGKAIQTDAKVSPVNYGGPLVDIKGRVQGILVPASPRGEGETAGIEWYDSGIGFAIPLEDINRVLPLLKSGKNLKRGFLGITPKSRDIYSTPAIIGTVQPESTAARAGLKPGDEIIEIDGKKITRQAQLMHALGNKYEKDTISLKVKRGDKVLTFNNLTLGGQAASFQHAFLGILPMRDDSTPGVEIRYVFAKSPAAIAGLKAGDRILSIAQGKNKPQPIRNREFLINILNRVMPGVELTFNVERKGGKKEDVVVKLGKMIGVIPDKLPQPASKKNATPNKKAGKVETGILERRNGSGDHTYWVYVPEKYDAKIAHAVLVWLHPAGQGTKKELTAMLELWAPYCDDHHMIMIAPQAANETGWLRSESAVVEEAIRDVASQYTVDRQRVVAHGMGVGGQLAFYLGFENRDVIRGVATTGAMIAEGAAKPNVANQRLAFFIVAGDKDPRLPAIRNTRNSLADHNYPLFYKEIKEMGHQYLDRETLEQMVRWIDALDRI